MGGFSTKRRSFVKRKMIENLVVGRKTQDIVVRKYKENQGNVEVENVSRMVFPISWG